MREFIKNRLKWYKTDRIQCGVSIASVFLLMCHIWQFIDSEYMIQPLIRICFYSVLLVSIFFLGRSIIFYLFLFLAYITTLFISFENYTSFIIIVIFLMVKIKGTNKRDVILTLILIGAYITCVSVVCYLHQKSLSHIAIHFVNCAFIYLAEFYFIKRKPPKRHLILDDLTKRILSELAKGKMQKEIDFCNKNTITTKLKNAIMDNNLLTKEQLLMRYIAEYVDNFQ